MDVHVEHKKVSVASYPSIDQTKVERFDIEVQVSTDIYIMLLGKLEENNMFSAILTQNLLNKHKAPPSSTLFDQGAKFMGTFSSIIPVQTQR